MNFDPAVFGPVAQIAAFSATGDQTGYATTNGQSITAYFSSASAALGQLPELPIFVVTVPVLASAPLGGTTAVMADPQSAWVAPDGSQYAINVTPSTFTVGGGLSVQAATPGGGFLPSGTVVQLTGTGFDSTTRVGIDGVSIARVDFISPVQVNLTLGGAIELTGKHFHVTNSTGVMIDYYSALPSAPADPGQGFTTMAGPMPILPMTTYASDEMTNPLVSLGGDWGFAMLNSNLTPVTVAFEGVIPAFQNDPAQFLYLDTVTIPAGQLYLLDATSMVRALQLPGVLWVTSSGPIRFIHVLEVPAVGASVALLRLPTPAVDPVPSIALALPASPNSVPWSWQVGTSAPTPAKVVLSGSLAFTTSVSTTGGQWLSVSSVRNGSSSTLTLTPDPSKLAAGSYSGTVTVTPIDPPSLVGAPVVSTTIKVSLTATSTAQISVTPPGCCLFYQVVMGQPSGPPQTVTVTSNGDPVQIAVSTSNGGDWLAVSPLSGTTPLQLTITANTTGLNAPLSGQIAIQGPGNTITLPVTVKNPLVPTLSPAVQGTLKINGPPPSVTLAAGTPPSMSWFSFLSFQEFDVALTSVTTNVSWLTTSIISPGPSPPTAPATIDLYANGVGLSPGVYSGVITIRSNYPTLQVPATLTVIQAATSQTMLTATPPSLSFTAQTGGFSSGQALTIGFNMGPVQFNIRGETQWLYGQPASASTAARPVYTFSPLGSTYLPEPITLGWSSTGAPDRPLCRSSSA